VENAEKSPVSLPREREDSGESEAIRTGKYFLLLKGQPVTVYDLHHQPFTRVGNSSSGYERKRPTSLQIIQSKPMMTIFGSPRDLGRSWVLWLTPRARSSRMKGRTSPGGSLSLRGSWVGLADREDLGIFFLGRDG
jgi:hypothetical protein